MNKAKHLLAKTWGQSAQTASFYIITKKKLYYDVKFPRKCSYFTITLYTTFLYFFMNEIGAHCDILISYDTFLFKFSVIKFVRFLKK